MKKSHILIVIVLAGTALSTWLYLTSDTRQIRNQLNTLVTLSDKKGPEQGIEALSKAAGIGKLFSEQCTLKLEEYGHSGTYFRKDITDSVFMIRNRSHQITVTMYDITIAIDKPTHAVLTLTLHLSGMVGEGDETAVDVSEIALTMNKEEGDWLIDSVTVVQVLER